MKRAILLVLDGCGAGPAPDWPLYDAAPGDTLTHVAQAAGGLNCPLLKGAGFLSGGSKGLDGFRVEHARLKPLGAGKDSVTGHWEMMGAVVAEPFPVYPDGFPTSLVLAFEEAIGRQILGNVAASGTEILDRLGPESRRTGKPILYTSADSVFQIAAHEDATPLAELYAWCEAARGFTRAQRVIARPFRGEAGSFVRTDGRKDLPLPAPPNLVDALAAQFGPVLGIGVVPELFGGRGFRAVRRTQNNAEHETALIDALAAGDAPFVWANFEDFDMRYGHRSDPVGFARCLEAFDGTLGRILERLTEDDLLLLTADHGNDPTDASTDHTREYAPYSAITRGSGVRDLGERDGFAHVGVAVASHLETVL